MGKERLKARYEVRGYGEEGFGFWVLSFEFWVKERLKAPASGEWREASGVERAKANPGPRIPSSQSLRRGKQARNDGLAFALRPIVAGKPGRRGGLRDRRPRLLRIAADHYPTARSQSSDRGTDNLRSRPSGPATLHLSRQNNCRVRSEYPRRDRCRVPKPGQALFCSTFLGRQKSGILVLPVTKSIIRVRGASPFVILGLDFGNPSSFLDRT
jgi:hypothetical protein